MKLKNKRTAVFVVICIVYFVFLAFLRAYAEESDSMLISFLLTDRFYIFQFSPVYLLSISFLSRHYSTLTVFRYKSKRIMIKDELGWHFIIAVALVSLLFLSEIICTLIMSQSVPSEKMLGIAGQYIRYSLGTMLLGAVSVFFEYSQVGLINKLPQICAFLVLCIDSLVIVPQLQNSLGVNIQLLFSWMFRAKFVWSCCALILITVVFSLLDIKVRSKGDFKP